MKSLKQVVWSEGMLLGQQHFQLWDDYIHAHQDFQREVSLPLGWGVVRAVIDEESLQNGQFQLNDYAIVFADGTVVQYDSDQAALSCKLNADVHGHASVYLGVPSNLAVSGISGYRDSTQLPGKVGRYIQANDRFDSTRTREVLLSTPNLHLLTEESSRDAFVSFKLADLVSEGNEKFRIASEYIPPVVHIKASPALLSILDRLLDVIRAKIRALTERRRQRSENVAEFSNADVAHFWLLNNLNMAIPELNYLRTQPLQHPERLFLTLSRLAGSLSTFSLTCSVESLPRYTHGDLGTVFRSLESTLRDLIDTVIPSNFSTIQLKHEAESLYSATQFDMQVLDSGVFYLGVKLESQDTNWMERFEKLAKVGSRDSIEMIVGSAMPGIQIRHQHRPPAQVPIRSHYEYFRIDGRGEFWDAVISARSIAVYVPQMFDGALIELLCTQE
jgi:type VI secretion system protein ImpJ